MTGDVEVPILVKHDALLEIIEVTVTGLVTGADIRQATNEGISLHRRTGITRFLVEPNESELSGSIGDIYDLPAEQYPKGDLAKLSRIAVILPTSVKARETARFYETTCRNRGWNVRLFPDRQSAIEWLRTVTT